MYAIILGCGRVGSQLAKILSEEGHNVVVVDKAPAAFNQLGADFNGVVLEGNGMDTDILKSAGIERADAFCALTNFGNTNVVASQVAKKMFGVKRVITRLYDPRKTEIYKRLGLDVLSGTTLFASMIRDKIMHPHFSNYLIETSQLGLFEIGVDERFAGKSVSDINLPEEFLVAAVKRQDKDIIPNPDFILQKGDVVIAVIRMDNLEKIKRIYLPKEEK